MIFRLISMLVNETNCLSIGDLSARSNSFPHTRVSDRAMCAVELIDNETYLPYARLTFATTDRRPTSNSFLNLCSVEYYDDGTIESFGRIRATTAISNIFSKYKSSRNEEVSLERMDDYNFFRSFN